MKRSTLAVILLTGLLLRLFLAVATTGNFDMRSYELVAEITQSGENVYASTSRYNYSPIWFLTLRMAADIGDSTGLPLHVIVRASLALVDISNAVLMGLIANRMRSGSGGQVAAIYALNPAVILISGFHGQFETLAAFPILLGILISIKSQWKSVVSTTALFIIGIVIKHNVLFLIWPFLVAMRGYIYATGVAIAGIAALMLTLLPFWEVGQKGIIQNVFLYSGVSRNFALAAILPGSLSLIVMVVCIAAAPFMFLKRPFYAAAAVILIWFLTGTFSIQYFTYLFIVAPFVMPNKRYSLIMSVLIALYEITYMLPLNPTQLYVLREPFNIIIAVVLAMWLISLFSEKFGIEMPISKLWRASSRPA